MSHLYRSISQNENLLAGAHENSLTESELFKIRQTFKYHQKWHTIFKRKVNKYKRKLKLKLKIQNKLEIQQDEQDQEYQRLRKSLKKQRIDILLEIVQHLKYLKSMAKVIKPAQKFYLQIKKAYRNNLLKVKRQQENLINELKAKRQTLQEQLWKLYEEIEDLKRKCGFYKQKRDEMEPKKATSEMKKRIVQQKLAEAEGEFVYEKASESNIVGFQKKPSELIINAKQKPKKFAKEKKIKSHSLHSQALKKTQKAQEENFKAKAFSNRKVSGISLSEMIKNLKVDTKITNLSKKTRRSSIKDSTSKRQSLPELPAEHIKKDSVNLKQISKKTFKRKRKHEEPLKTATIPSVFGLLKVSHEASVMAPISGTVHRLPTKSKPKTIESIIHSTKGEAFQARHLLQRASIAKLPLEPEMPEEIDEEERTSLSAFISLYNVHDEPSETELLKQLPKIKEQKRPSVSFGEKFFKDLIKSQKETIRQKIVLERQKQKELELEREFAEQEQRERIAAEILSRRLSDAPETKLDKLVRRALQSTFAHADIVRKDLSIVDEDILRTFKRRRTFGSSIFSSKSFNFTHKYIMEFGDDDNTKIEQQKMPKHEEELAAQNADEEKDPALKVEDLITRYFAQLEKEQKKSNKKVKKFKKRKVKRSMKKRRLLIATEEEDEPKLVCSCCGMTTLQIAGPCC